MLTVLCAAETTAAGRVAPHSQGFSQLPEAAWAHAVDIDGARPHYHKAGTELYYVLDGEGTVVLDGVEHEVRTGSIVHIPPGVVHGAKGRMRVLVVGVPDISDGDLYFPPTESPA